jgi:response regulator RpfG family c-di-GMP phosphodiesterase
MKYKLLIVDDEAPNIRLLERLFRDEYHCLTATSGAEATDLLDQHDFAVIITDQRMPQMSGLELLKRSADRRPHMVRILLTGYTDLDALMEAINCGLVYLYVSKPWNNEDLKAKVSRAIEHYEHNKRQHQLIAASERLTVKMKEMKLGAVRVISTILKMHDEYIFNHSVRVSKYSSVIGETLGLAEELLEDLTAAAFLHQLGSIGSPVSSEIGGFGTTEIPTAEYQPDRAARALSCLPDLREISDIVRYQGENYDGSGLPTGLAGEQIPLASRIVRVASEYDLMTNPRHSIEALSHDEAIAKLQSFGEKLDGQLVQVLSDLPSDAVDTLHKINSVPVRPELITVAVN